MRFSSHTFKILPHACFCVCEQRYKINQTLTSDLKLTVLSGAEHRVSQAEPWQLLAELRQEIVCNEPYNSGQDIQDKAKSRLRIKSKKRKFRIKKKKSVDIFSLKSSEKCVGRTR